MPPQRFEQISMLQGHYPWHFSESSHQRAVRRSITALSAALFLFLTLAPVANSYGETPTSSAGSVVIGGLSFPVDELKELDSGSVRLGLGGTTTILAKSEVNARVVEWAFHGSSIGFRPSTRAVFGFAETAAAQGEWRLVASAVRFLCRSQLDVEEIAGLSALVEQLRGSANGPKLLKEIIRAEQQSVGVGVVFASAAIADPKEMRAEFLPLVLRNYDLLVRVVRREVLDALRRKDFDRADELLGRATLLFGVQDGSFAPLTQLSRQLRSALVALDRDSLSEVPAILVRVSREPDAALALVHLVVSELHQKANAAISADDSNRAIRVLSLVPVERRTPTTHQLVALALTHVRPSAESALNDPDVRLFLAALAPHDSGIRELLLQVGADQLALVGRSRQFDLGEQLLAFLSGLAGEDRSELDAARLQYGLVLYEVDRPVAAQTVISAITSELGMGTHLRLWLRGYYGSPTDVLIIALIPFFAASLLVVRYRRQSHPTTAERERIETAIPKRRHTKRVSELEAPEEDEPVRPAFTRISKVSPQGNEYQSCLAQLQLPIDADERAIKAAYRTLIKEVHPDLNPNSTEEQKQRFVTLTQVYERALELRAQLGK